MHIFHKKQKKPYIRNRIKTSVNLELQFNLFAFLPWVGNSSRLLMDCLKEKTGKQH